MNELVAELIFVLIIVAAASAVVWVITAERPAEGPPTVATARQLRGEADSLYTEMMALYPGDVGYCEEVNRYLRRLYAIEWTADSLYAVAIGEHLYEAAAHLQRASGWAAFYVRVGRGHACQDGKPVSAYERL